MFGAGWILLQGFVRKVAGRMDIKDVFLCMDELYCIMIYTNVT